MFEKLIASLNRLSWTIRISEEKNKNDLLRLKYQSQFLLWLLKNWLSDDIVVSLFNLEIGNIDWMIDKNLFLKLLKDEFIWFDINQLSFDETNIYRIRQVYTKYITSLLTEYALYLGWKLTFNSDEEELNYIEGKLKLISERYASILSQVPEWHQIVRDQSGKRAFWVLKWWKE